MQSDVLALIGNTPLVELKNYQEKNGLQSKIFAKLEGHNPFGSTKDRAALFMIEAAEKCGHLNSDSTIIEPTSGNTGIALAAIAAIKGYKTIIVMPSNVSAERIAILKLYGAKVVLTPGKDGMNGAIKKALELKNEIKNSYIPDQFTNEFNVKAHEETTAREILDSKISFDYLVCGVGTGGTITGVGKVLKKHQPNIKIVAVEPSYSAVLTEKVKCAKNKILENISLFPPDQNSESQQQQKSSSSSKAIEPNYSPVLSEEAKYTKVENHKNISVSPPNENSENQQQKINSSVSKTAEPNYSPVLSEKVDAAQSENTPNISISQNMPMHSWHKALANKKAVVEKASNIVTEKLKSPQIEKSKGNKDISQNVQGLGAGFIPEICDTKVIDFVEKVSYQEAINEVKNLAKTEGLLVGISSGAALCAAKQLAKKSKLKNILVIFPDGGEKYLSNYTKIYL